MSSSPLPGMSSSSPAPLNLPHELKGLVAYGWGLPSETILALLALAVAAVGLGLAFWWWYKRRKQRVKLGEHPILGMAREIATLMPPEPFVRAAQADYFFKLSMLLRQVIEVSCGFPATDLTLKELRLPLRSFLPFPVATVDEILKFCERAELIKFASADSERGEALAWQRQVNSWAGELVSRTLQPQGASSRQPAEMLNPQSDSNR